MPRRLRADFYLHWIENPKLRVRGWNIRVSYIDEGRLRYRRKLVSEFRYGGTKKSLMVIAMRLRDRIIAELGTSTFGVPYFQREKSSRNTSGHIGVYRNIEVKNRKIQVIWAARWTDAQGKVVMRRFSARRHGEENAKKLAIMARSEGIRQTAEAISEKLSLSRYSKSKLITKTARRISRKREMSSSRKYELQRRPQGSRNRTERL